MRAMILAAGLGTRLLPFTQTRPKPLFALGGRPLLDILIRDLQKAGFDTILVNTHHLSDMIIDFVTHENYGIPVVVKNEPTILGTGGAIKNVQDLWDNEPLLVVNGDIFTNIDFKGVYNHHLRLGSSVTMVLHDRPPLNTVGIDSKNQITGFHPPQPPPGPESSLLAFTGIHVLEHDVLDFIPRKTFVGIIEVYEEMIEAGHTIGALIVENQVWHDIGTPQGYQEAAAEVSARKVLEGLVPSPLKDRLSVSRLQGDGSDRKWQRFAASGQSIVVATHSLFPERSVSEADSFFAIGRHLEAKGIPVPHIYHFDKPAGIIAMEDLGDRHFQKLVVEEENRDTVVSRYKPLLDILVTLGTEGAREFDTRWTYQTPYYDRQVIRERECDYFFQYFLAPLSGLSVRRENLQEDFALLSDRGLSSNCTGLIHRDFQSRNVLVYHDRYYVIDFQGARLGPLAYDLASLLIDPYVRLDYEIEEELLAYYWKRLSAQISMHFDSFCYTYRYCAVNRNLQALGAFGFLSKVKGKSQFEAYIPPALDRLRYNLARIDSTACRTLKETVNRLQQNPEILAHTFQHLTK